jgi:hypothetical protein
LEHQQKSYENGSGNEIGRKQYATLNLEQVEQPELPPTASDNSKKEGKYV